MFAVSSAKIKWKSRKIGNISATLRTHKTVFCGTLRTHCFSALGTNTVVVVVYFSVTAKTFHKNTSCQSVAILHGNYTLLPSWKICVFAFSTTFLQQKKFQSMFGTLKVFCKQKALSKSVRRFVCKLCLFCKVSAVTVFLIR